MQTDSLWIHVEYAAGNYGNSIAFGNLFRRSNYEVLRTTVNKLFSEHGPRGIIFVNDLIEEWAQMAASWLEKYVMEKGWTGIEVRVLAGDVTQIAIPCSHTANLKNPRIGLITLDGYSPFFKKLSLHSKNGLEITTHYPKILLTQSETGKWKLESLGAGERYRFPSGRRRRLATERFLLRNERQIPDAQIHSEANRKLGRPVRDYQPPVPTWVRTSKELWHAFLVTLGIRRQ